MESPQAQAPSPMGGSESVVAELRDVSAAAIAAALDALGSTSNDEDEKMAAEAKNDRRPMFDNDWCCSSDGNSWSLV